LSDSRTHVTSLAVFQSIEDRERELQSDMETALNDSYARLDEFLAKELAK
jgi:hypothetical protein